MMSQLGPVSGLTPSAVLGYCACAEGSVIAPELLPPGGRGDRETLRLLLHGV